MATADRNRNSTELSEFLRPVYSSCMMCSGFYGNNFGQPVCSTCHLFLFSCDINKEEGNEDVYLEKADSGDSGNEEPELAQDFCETPVSMRLKQVRGAQHSHKTDKLAERITMLTTPRERDNIPEGLVDSLPPEVLLSVFKNLDDISLWTAGMVCSRWEQLLQVETTETQWKEFIKLRWPLFNTHCKVKNWKTIFTKLHCQFNNERSDEESKRFNMIFALKNYDNVESSPCRYCLESMMLQSTPPIEENSWRHRRLRSELKTLKSDPPEGIRAEPLDRHCCHWQASITGPQGSPYEGGFFLLYLQIPDSYPMRPPKVQFITKIFHPNISRHGDVGLDSIHYNWSLALTISKVLISIQSLLTDPFCDVCMEPTIGRLYQRNRKEFDRIARLWTWKHAMHDFLMPMEINLNGV